MHGAKQGGTRWSLDAIAALDWRAVLVGAGLYHVLGLLIVAALVAVWR